jgi:hypothetical protein
MSAPVLVHDSLAEIPEDKLVDRIVTDIQWGHEFFQFYGMPSGMENRQCVPLQTAPGNPKGDIDVLFRAPDLPQQAVAYQIKRVKCGINQLPASQRNTRQAGGVQETRPARIFSLEWDSGRYTPMPSWWWTPESKTQKKRTRGR